MANHNVITHFDRAHGSSLQMIDHAVERSAGLFAPAPRYKNILLPFGRKRER
jgi:hypothetical protein